MTPEAVAPVAKTLRHRTIASAVAEELRARILDGRIPAGEPLRQEALAQALAVSRIPLREALVQLEAEGLVRIEPHKGAVVLELSSAEIAEVFDLRAALEPKLLAASAPRLDAGDFAALDAILAAYSAALSAENVGRWGEINTELHARLYAKADLPRTAGIVAGLLQASDRYSRLHLSQTDDRSRAEAEHIELVALCRAGNIEAASKLLSAHIANAGERLAEMAARRREPRALTA